MDKADPKDKYQVKVVTLEDYEAQAACQDACPLGTDNKGYVKAIAEGDFEKAFLIARQTNPLVFVCSRVCHAPCEKACVKAEGNGSVSIRALKRFVCDEHGVASPSSIEKGLEKLSQRDDWISDQVGNHILALSKLSRQAKDEKEHAQDDSPRVAIIGSGPAGLAAAHDLALLGYGVTIFEAASIPGGLLRMGIPEFRLPKGIVEQEINAILDLGVEMKLNTPIGEDRSLTDLQEQGYESIFITIGLQDPVVLDLEGAGLKGVHEGIVYIRDSEEIPKAKTCLVIGGGGVAIDCAQQAVRQGAEKVMVACLESWDEMPAGLSEKEDAQEEGIEFYSSLGPKRILGQEGRVIGVEFLKVESVFDGKGKFNPVYEPDTETILKADTVILAVGQASSLPSLSGMEGLDMTSAGMIRVGEDMSTSLPGVFAGGDVRWSLSKSVSEAMADGQRAARTIHEYLSDTTLQVKRKTYMRPLPRDFENIRGDDIRRVRSPKRPVKERITNCEEIRLTFEEEQARQQAARCRQCNIQTVFDRSRCLLCGTCVEGCLYDSLKMVRVADLQGNEEVETLTRAAKKMAPAKGVTAIIKDESRCVRCGVCARRCPGGAITMEAFQCEEEWEWR